MKEMPVYLFTGFLGAGKTTFIQEVMESDEFNQGEKTLLLVCEEGEVEYDPSSFAFPNVYIEFVDDEDELTPEYLTELENEHDIERVVIEYNGMWMLKSLYDNAPSNWTMYQEMAFADANTFLMYNKNMRQLTFDKMRTAELDVFNRCEKGFDKMPFHQEVRIANRHAQIVYEYAPNDIEPDMIQDPLPYDIRKDEIEINDEDFAEWYRDINENPSDYEGKTLKIKGRVAVGNYSNTEKFIFGRHVMTCCEADIQFAGIIGKYKYADNLTDGQWVFIEAKVEIGFEEAYGGSGPLLVCRSVRSTEPPYPEIAVF